MEYKFDEQLLIEGEKLSKDEINEYIAKNVAEIVCLQLEIKS